MKVWFRHNIPKLSLGTKAALAAVSALILVSIIFTALFFSFYKQSLINELRNRAFTLANNLAYNSSYPVIANDLESLHKLVSGVVIEKDMEKAIIIGKKGKILASTDSVDSVSKIFIEVPSTIKNQVWFPTSSRNLFRAITPIVIENRDEIFDESVLLSPLRKSMPQGQQIYDKARREIVGFVILEVSLINLNQVLLQNLLRAIIITTLIIIFGGLVTAFVVQKIVQPLRVLAQATKKIANGEFGKTIPITRTDEIGTLANSFNEMTLKLKKSRDDYEALNRELEIKVAESTTELNAKYMELEQTLASFKKKDLDKDDLLAFISHEVRNPLSSIQLYSEMILKGFEPYEKKREDFLNNIINNCQRLSRFLTDILDCLKLESKKMKYRLADFNLIDLIKEVLTSLEPNLRAKNLQCNQRFREDKIDICSDRDKLFQVLSNIIFNATKFSYQDSEIVVSLKESDDAVEITVRDYGIGIKKEDIPKLFDKFTQLGQMHYDHIGSGLGLTISKSIIEQLGGRITIDSTFGEGTTVSIRLLKKVKSIT